jgi:hypothetical protein
MKARTILVPVDYFNYSPHPVIIGVMRASMTTPHDEARILNEVAATHPHWDTLAFAEQTPVGWSRRNALRIKAQWSATAS